MKNTNPYRRVHDAWGRLGVFDRLQIYGIAVFVSFSVMLSEAVMKFRAKTLFVSTVVAYIVFFLLFADRLPQWAFVAGIFLGMVLGATVILLLLPQNHNGNNHSSE